MKAGKQSDIILLDFSKAFDKINHEKLTFKLHGYGIRGKTLKRIEAFLHSRSQTVVLEGDCSEHCENLPIQIYRKLCHHKIKFFK